VGLENRDCVDGTRKNDKGQVHPYEHRYGR
jgi:hypothetical protein